MPRVVDALAKKENKKIQIVKKKSWLLTVKNIITRIRTKLSLGSKLRKFHCYLITRKNKRKKPLLKNEDKDCVADVSLGTILGSKSADEHELNNFMNKFKKDNDNKDNGEETETTQKLNTTKGSTVDKDEADEKDNSNDDRAKDNNVNNNTKQSQVKVQNTVSDDAMKNKRKQKDDKNKTDEGHDGDAVTHPVQSENKKRKTTGVIKKRVIRKKVTTKSGNNNSNRLGGNKFQSPYRNKEISPMKTRTGTVGRTKTAKKSNNRKKKM